MFLQLEKHELWANMTLSFSLIPEADIPQCAVIIIVYSRSLSNLAISSGDSARGTSSVFPSETVHISHSNMGVLKTGTQRNFAELLSFGRFYPASCWPALALKGSVASYHLWICS